MDFTRTSAASPDRRLRPPVAILILVAALAVALATYALRPIIAHPSAPTVPLGGASRLAIPAADGPPAGVVASAAALDKAIGVWTANLKADPADWVSAGNLGLDYYARGRVTGDVDSYARALAAVRQGLAAYPSDPGARTMQALLSYTLHDFAGSLRLAQTLYDADHSQLPALATIGDDQLELGRYAAAGETFAALQQAQPGAAVTARLAHLAAIEGRDAEAAALAAQAVSEAKASGADAASLAFYPYLQGFIAFQAGDLALAGAAYQAALADWPGSYLALEGLARVRAAQGQTDAAIGLLQRAIAIVPQPQSLSELGDLYALTGRPVLTEQEYATVRAIAGLQALQAQVFNRQLVLFDVNHGRSLAEALSLAQRELAVRQDVYGWDADAWALLANGRAAEAESAMREALSQGTHDSLLDYHAGMIAHALGDDAQAASLLRSALERNAGFDPLQATRARALLATIQARS